MSIIIEKVSLNFTDLLGSKTGCTTLGSNKFWVGWVEDNGDNTFNFECRWGPTGTPGSDKGSVRGVSEDRARRTLASKAASKRKKGYTDLETRTLAEEQSKVGIAPLPAPSTPAPVVQVHSSTIHPEVEKLLSVIYGETSKAVRAGISSHAGSSEGNPIGNLSDRQLDLGGGILDQIEDLLKSHLGPRSTTGYTKELPLDRWNMPLPAVVNATNEYMSNIPRAIPREKRGKNNLHQIVVSSYERLDAERMFLQLLRDAHLSQDVFKAAATETTTSGKAHVWYQGLNSLIEFCAPGGSEFNQVKSWFETNQSRRNANWFRGGNCILRVSKVFRMVRNGTEAAFERYATQVAAKPGAVGRIMAWHGTPIPNILGISKSGLLMPENLPRGVHISGKAFGRGIYHAPAWPATGTNQVNGHPTDGTNGALKSMNYTGLSGAAYSGGRESTAYLFLQDVALGCADVHFSACWDKPRPNNFPHNDFIFACGTKNQGGFIHDEVVTFSQDAQMFRYLLEIKSC
jgi:predicted DNA-binding WGR domain protein